MALQLIIASLLAATSHVPAGEQPATTPAPPGGPETRYCLRVDPLPGSNIETVLCKTRYEWSLIEIDVDQEWAQNGVRVI